MATFVNRPGPNGRKVWQARIRKRGWPPQTRTFDRKSEAAAWARQVEGEMERGIFRDRIESERTTIADLIDRYVDEVAPLKRSTNQILSTVRHLSRELGCYSVAALRPKDVAEYRDRRLRAVGTDTVRKELGALKSILNVSARDWGLYLPFGNPVGSITSPSPGRSRDRRLFPGEEPRLLAASRAYGGSIEPLIILALETAMRRGELAAMRWNHLDRQARVLLVPESKTGEPRRVPLSLRALAVLDALPCRIDGCVWGIRADSITQAFDRSARRARAGYEAEFQEPDSRMLTDLRFHDLRHEATSRLFEKGLNPMEVATITGHKSMQMLKRYTHLRAEDLVKKLG